ncbi:ABC transporter permease [Novosphingobium sp. P6W]|uniref:ABC transporter permease n=1 Tax=Novosphingobium sp. P6W TaxID=1609758 RepID=UPI0005C2C9E5|nr:ABC transporter permease [Novosphingobium sp. P6W]AXB78535.1 ABC transporter permease [Novosphingobium sp. P6W]KIS30618.1 ABC transporter permease [Novosphingobium sp. P6W]
MPMPSHGSARSRLTFAAIRIAPIAGILLLWEIAALSGIWPRQVLVPLEQIGATLLALASDGELERHLSASLYRLASGFCIGSVIGVATGAAMALSRNVHRLLWPTFTCVRQVPVIAFIPLLILFFDVEDSFKIVIVAMASFFPSALATHDAVRDIPESHREVARLYRMPLAPFLVRLILPATVPQVLTGLRLGLTRGWLSLVAAELLAADSGLGQMMEMGRQLFQIDVVLAGVFVTGLVGFLLDNSMVRIERHLGRWRTA